MNSRAKTFSWGIVDQGLCSISNLLLAVATARSVGVRDFGLFGLALGFYLSALGIARSLVGVPLTLTPEDSRGSSKLRAALGSALLIGVCAATVMVVTGLVMRADEVWYVIALGLPVLLVQDTLRYAAIARLTPRTAAVSDGIWLAVQMLILIAPIAVGGKAVGVSSWLIGAAVSIVAFAHYWPGAPRPSAGARSLRETWSDRKYLLLEFIMNMGVQQAAFVLVTLFWGLPVVAALRGAQIILGPANVFTAGLYPIVTRHVASAERWPSRWRLLYFYTVTGVVVPLATALAAVLLPAEIGRRLLGETWQPAVIAAVPLSLAACAYVVISAGVLYLIGTRQYRSGFQLRFRSASLLLLCLIVLGATAGPSWAAWAWFMGYLLGILLLVPVFRAASINENRRLA